MSRSMLYDSSVDQHYRMRLVDDGVGDPRVTELQSRISRTVVTASSCVLGMVADACVNAGQVAMSRDMLYPHH